MISLELDGQEMAASMLENARIVVKGKRFTSTGMGAVYQGTLELDASQTPGHINMRFDAGPEKGNTNLGIYEFDGNTWKICLATRGSVRPISFASSQGTGFAFETFRREDAPGAAKAKPRISKTAEPATTAKAPATEFEGEWSMVSGIMNGRAMNESDVKWVKRVFQGNQTTVYAGPQVMLKVEFTNDSSTSPKSIDYLNIAGSNKGKTQHGIYEFTGDLLKICVSAPETSRPAEFRSKPGDGRTLTVWKRA